MDFSYSDLTSIAYSLRDDARTYAKVHMYDAAREKLLLAVRVLQSNVIYAGSPTTGRVIQAIEAELQELRK